MKFSTPLALLVVPLAAVATTQPDAIARTGTAQAITKGGISVLTDSKCVYPFSKAQFSAAKFAGPTPEEKTVWYTWASSENQGCSCDSAAYGTFPNGSLALTNSCVRDNMLTSIMGYADPVQDFAAGSYKTKYYHRLHKAVAGPADCSGPNFIIQQAYVNKPGEAKIVKGEGNYETVIVGSSNFDHFWLLSKTREASREIIDDYLKDVWTLGTNNTIHWTYAQQSNCKK